MAPSEATVQGNGSTANPAAIENSTKTPPPPLESSMATTALMMPNPPTTSSTSQKSKIETKPSGLDTKAPTGAELKKKAKAEKAARREKERQNAQQVQNTSSQNGGSVGGRRGSKGQGADTGASSHQSHPQARDKRSGSMATHDRPLAIRSGGSTGAGGSKLPSNAAIPMTDSKSSTKKDNSKQVALFSHLYSHFRRTTITNSSREVHPSVLALGIQFSNYVICGSSARCVATLLVFKRVIESYTTPPSTTLTRHLPSHLSVQIDHLVSCRPLSVSMGNAIRWLKLEISHVDISTRDSDAKIHLCTSIDNFIRERITVADQVIATTASAKIVPGDVILTYAKSNIVLQTLLRAHRNHQSQHPLDNPSFRVVLIDSRPLFEGRAFARSLTGAGIPVTYTLLSGLSHAITSATKVLLGAHAMMSNGRLYSRVGTAAVAMAAHAEDVPVIVCCESVKFTERVGLDSVVTNEVAPAEEIACNTLGDWKAEKNLQLLNLMYDVTPAEYIQMVVTEYGSLPPSSVPVVYRLSTNT